VDGVLPGARDAAAALVEVDDRRLVAGADVVDAAVLPERGDRRSRDISHVHVVAGLEPVAEDARLLAACERAEEDRDDARLAVRILPRPVHVAVAEGDVPRLVKPVVRAQVLLPSELRRAVRGERRQRGRLRGGPVVALAVDRASRRAEHDLRAVSARGLEHAHGSQHVHLGVVHRLLDRDAHVRLRREMENRLGPKVVDEIVERLADVVHVERRLGGHVLALPVGEGIQDDDLVVTRDERVHHVRADEARSTCHQHTHRGAS